MWHHRERCAERLEIACTTCCLAQAADGTFEVAHLAQGFAQPSQKIGRGEQPGDEILPCFQRRDITQWIQKPLAKLPRAEGRDRAVKRLKEARASLVARAHDFEMRLRNIVEDEEPLRPVRAQRQ